MAAHSFSDTQEKERKPQFFLFHCSSNMKRAASLNYLNQPSAAPLQVRVVLVSFWVGGKERTAAGQAQQSPGRAILQVGARELGLSDGIRQPDWWWWW